MSDPIRWLHLSDFHVGKDDWAQWRLFEKIIEHVADQKGKGFVPEVSPRKRFFKQRDKVGLMRNLHGV